VAGLGVAAILLALPALASASFPGKNGKIAFSDGGDIWLMNADGTDRTALTAGPAGDGQPDWSPDGTQIAFSRDQQVFVMNADGSNQHEIVDGGGKPSWSPDGARIAYTDGSNIWAVDPDGTNRTHVVIEEGDEYFELTSGPSWSPDGTQMLLGILDCTFHCVGFYVEAFDIGGGPDDYFGDGSPLDWAPDAQQVLYLDFETARNVYRNHRGGSGAFVTADGSHGGTWSPDGTKVAIASAYSPSRGEISVMNPDGSNATILGFGSSPDWQSIPINSYPRPRAATLQQVSLVPAYSACSSPNRTHGPPLAYDSCNPPAQASDEATLGTPDANGRPLKGEGKARYTTLAGDVRIELEVADVYDRSTLADYAGELRLHSLLRITDKRNTPHPGGPGAGTVTDTILGATAPCTATADPNQGASCVVSTTANALAPGTVSSGARTVWGLGQTRVDDGGADGDADTPGDNTLFMVQGVFVP
jgi:Tol biopolymer transport system component